LAIGLGLSQIGEFAFVLGSIARGHGALSDERYLLVVSSAIVSLFLTPFVVPYAPKLGIVVDRVLRRGAGRKVTPEEERAEAKSEIVIIGFGPAGEAAGRALRGSEKVVRVVDLNAEAMERCKALGLRGQVGDALQVDVLEHAGVRHAEVVVITLPAAPVAMAVVRHVRKLAPHAHLVVRSRYERNQSDFETAGADVVFGDEYEVGEKLARYLQYHLGMR
jgi:CPA2 family monovalent cation:H+ antiporter-2